MGMLSRWTARRRAAQGQTPAPDLVRSADGPVSPRLAQALRIQRKAEQYRQQIRAEAAARQGREAEQERARGQRAQDEFEDQQARALAMGPAWFPGDEDGALREPPGGIRVIGFGTWAASVEDWRARVDEAQAEEIRRGGRGVNP